MPRCSRNEIKEAYLETYKACNKETNQSPFLLMLELAYKNTTEQAFKDVLNPILQKMLEPIVRDAENDLARAQAYLSIEWELRSLSRIGSLAFSALAYLTAKRQAILSKGTQETLDLNSVHNFTRVAKLFGKPFNIATDTDEVAERTFSNIAMNPQHNGFVTTLNLYIPLSLGKFYWDIQLAKIIRPWLTTHFEEQTYFQLNDLTQWFHHLLEGFKTESNTNEIDAMQEELLQEIPKINGHPLAEYQMNERQQVHISEGSLVFEHGREVLLPTTQALLAFAYGINLLKIKDPQTPSFFNHIDQKMRVFENEDLDFTSLGRVIRRVSPFMERVSRFLPEHIQEKLQELNEPRGQEEIIRNIRNFRWDLVYHIDKDALFFAQ